MHKVRYGLFFDNHTQMENPDVGKNFNADVFTDQIRRCGVDYLAFHARCNVGMAYYNTKIGIRHPSLHYDLFGELAKSCKEKGIALVAYLNGGISVMEGVRHRDWTTRYRHGNKEYEKIGPAAVTMCYNSPYRDHLIAMIREIASNYPVHGFFIDSLVEFFPCVCPVCIEKMNEQGIDWREDRAVTEFARQSMLRLCRDISTAVREIIPDPMLYFNGPVFGDVKEIETFFDCECLPTASWGYEFLPIMAHYMRNVKQGTPIFNMTGRFYAWGDFGGLRPAESLKFDLFYGLAHGMRPNIGGHFHPRGDKDSAVFERIASVYHELQRYDEWYSGAENLTDTAIVYPCDDRDLRILSSIRSSVRMLEELKIQFDIVLADSEKSWDRYRLLILPEGVRVNAALASRIRDFISKGGAFFACGKQAAEAFGPELGIQYLGESGLDPVYFQMNGEFDRDIDDMFLSLYAGASRAKQNGAKGLSRLVKPYYNKSWNGSYALYYTPPQESTDMPFLTVKDKCVWCAGDLFSGYFNRGAIHLRNIFRNVVDSLLEKPWIKTFGMPMFARAVLSGQPGRKNVHLLGYVPEKRGDAMVVEEAVPISDAVLHVFTDGKKPLRVYLAPDRIPLNVTMKDEYAEVKIPVFKGYALIVLEE